ncbi:THAP domain-containing protein 5-like [Dendropsophus ebraccatus]|uniref:THAP domain-containing protein 5-like n=1 Tax=Dendropsophus ebraccatus TaxID=150705 RepID=UPI0038317932
MTSRDYGKRHFFKSRREISRTMPKSCVVPECRRAETGRESYYKFPLHDKVRLKQWLTNLNMENFFPTKNQYLCSKHFKASCFQIRWGVRYLRHDAVPTIFSSSPVVPGRVQVTKSRTLSSVQNLGTEACISTVSPFVIGNTQVLPETVTIALDPNASTGQIAIDGAGIVVKNTDPTAVMGAVNLVPLVHFVESFDGLSLALAPSQGFQTVALPIVVSGEHQIQQIPLVEQVGFLSEEHIATTTLQQDYYEGQVLQSVGEEVPTVIEMSDPGALVMENISIEPFFEAGLPTPAPATMTTEDVMSYLETMQTATLVPVVSSGPLPLLVPSQETVLSSSTDRPIPSTVPIVSKHNKEASSAYGSQDLMQEPSDGLAEGLSTTELVSVVMNLQNKVSALQQRHQKHCSKLEVMEGVVDQLKKENLIAEDKLNFLELACLNGTPIQTEETETIAIVCDDADQTLLYALPLQGENRTILHVTEQ